jgi:tRNA 2-selenouridine synthase
MPEMNAGHSQSSELAVEVPKEPGASRIDYRSLLLSGTRLLDVRAPVEFEKGAFPESVNLPLMTDEERHLVGIRYKEKGQQSAIELGTQLVTPELRKARVKAWAGFFEQHPDAALYCFRGGLRSRIAQQWLKEAGVDIPLVAGGYKALRSYLISSLDSLCTSMGLVLIGGRTGNGKTLLIKRLGHTVDLEALANHRGSSFGGMVDAQPRNIDFENAVTIELLRHDEAGATCVYLEDEARLIGRVCLPYRLRDAMQQAPILILECDMEQRIQHCFDDYVPDLLYRYTQSLGNDAGFDAYCEHHRGSLARIQNRFGDANYKKALELLERALIQHKSNDDTSYYSEFIELLLCEYYDPMYDYQLSKKQERVAFKGYADDIVGWVNRA